MPAIWTLTENIYFTEQIIEYPWYIPGVHVDMQHSNVIYQVLKCKCGTIVSLKQKVFMSPCYHKCICLTIYCIKYNTITVYNITFYQDLHRHPYHHFLLEKCHVKLSPLPLFGLIDPNHECKWTTMFCCSVQITWIISGRSLIIVFFVCLFVFSKICLPFL